MQGNRVKKFVYKSLPESGKNAEQKFQKSNDKCDFPDDLNMLLSQPASKKFKLNNGTKKRAELLVKKENMFDEFEDGFDFNEAENEINSIEIAATQQVNYKKLSKSNNENDKIINNPDCILDELMDDNFGCEIVKEPCSVPLINKNTLKLKLPKKNSSSFSSSHKEELPVDGSVILNTKKEVKVEEKIVNNNQSYKLLAKLPENIATAKQLIENNKTHDIICQLNDLKCKLTDSERRYQSKDGEIKILRESIRKMSEQEYKLKESVNKLENELKTQQSEKEKNLLLEVERLQTQLTFNQKEIESIQEQNKKLIIATQKKKIPSNLKGSPKTSFNAEGFKESSVNQSLISFLLPKVSSESSKLSSEKCYKTESKMLYNALKNSMKCFPTSSSYWNKFNKIKDNNKQLFFCNHTDNLENKSEIETYSILQSSLLILEYSDIYIGDFLNKIIDYISNLKTMLLTCEVRSIEPIKSINNEKHNNQVLCSHCKKVYQEGLYSLFILGESCLVCKSINSCFLERPGYEIKREHKKSAFGDTVYLHKYENDDQCMVLVESMESSTINDLQHSSLFSNNQSKALKIWKILQEVNNLDQVHFADLFEMVILFYTKLTMGYHNSDILVEYLIKEQLLAKFLQKPTLAKCSSVLYLFQNCLTCNDIYNLICTKSDNCPLLFISQSIVKDMNCSSSYDIFNELVQCLSSLISTNQTKALDTLLDIDCQCAIEVVENIVIFLANNLKTLQREAFSTNDAELTDTVKNQLIAFRQGLSLLCVLCTNDKKIIDKQSSVEWTYIYLLGSAISLFRRMPTVSENEVHALEDLLEMEQYMDVSEETHTEQEIIQT
ncbi:putative leucine-rich repeat-containing protein DDB_G0290503 isoform X2 [Hydra vulgaris]|uniref:Leucine-rich repeat-containing protein DDB_G0290503 isoform X2 n=1 Tax=Hydra vulgaris TaxID=6087 RepID=A0ABM4CJ82_HYDVU